MRFSKDFFICNWRKILYFVLCILFIAFLVNGKVEVINLIDTLSTAKLEYILLGVVASILFILFQSISFQYSLTVVNARVPLPACIVLFLKRFFVSSFIPVGFSASQYTFSSKLEAFGVTKPQSHLASTFYLISGYLSYLIISIPTLAYLTIQKESRPVLIISVLILIGLVSLLYFELMLLLKHKGIIYRFINRKFPKLQAIIDDLSKGQIRQVQLLKSVAISLLGDIQGAVFIILALAAIGQSFSIFHAIAAFVISILILTISPIFQGVIIFEVSMVYALTMFGVDQASALAGILIYRLFQLWIPLILGAILLTRKAAQRLLPSKPEVSR